MNKEVRKLDSLISCIVPVCKNTVMNNPNKHFFYVPKSARIQWCAAINKKNVPKSGSVYICEDHLTLEADLLNYDDWVVNKVIKPRLKPQVPNHLKNIGAQVPSTSAVAQDYLPMTMTQEKGVLCVPECNNKAVQVKLHVIDRCVGTKSQKLKTHLYPIEEESSEGLCPSAVGSTTDFSANESSTSDTYKTKKQFIGRNFILSLIKNKPFAYIGVPEQFYWIVDHLSKELKIPSINIIVVLYKIKNNETFAKMKDLFEISIATLWRTFYPTLKALRKFFNQLLYWPNAIDIKKNLPTAFTTNQQYASVQTIIDCYEIEIEKPKKPTEQALTWSSYKNCNTIKYLIGATPDGFINFISEGYGGRITDMYLVEQSGFLECVPAGATILADRGFKHLESHLVQKNVTVLRPPTVLKYTKMTKSEVIDSKVIASLRIHIERVIRRIRLFKILKPHAVVNNKLINVLDAIVIVACGLVNLQSSVIKK